MTLFLKNLVFTLLAPGTVALVGPWLIVREHAAAAEAWPAAALLFLLGTGIYLRCVWDFATFGRGTPAPIDAPKRLVVRGLYRYTRNPMYLGVLTTILGWAVLFRDPGVSIYALLVGTVFHLFILLYEEPHLERTFGGAYVEYRSHVGRWIPGIRWQANRRNESGD
jgi:protein-S-isoprenylcysteine O-methyltransferase Ste14